MREIKVTVAETPITNERFPNDKFVHIFKCGDKEFRSGMPLPWRELLSGDPARVESIDGRFAEIQEWLATKDAEIQEAAKECDAAIAKLNIENKAKVVHYRSAFRKDEYDDEMYFAMRDGEAVTMVIEAKKKMLFAEAQKPNMLKMYILRMIQGGLKMLLPLQIVVTPDYEDVIVWHSPLDQSGKVHEKPMETDILRDFPAVVSALFGKEEAQRLIDKRLKKFETFKSEADVNKELHNKAAAERLAREAVFGKGNAKQGDKKIIE